ncbi:MAG: flagellar protein FlaG [Lachnospiraceae bacterium]|nr:flagellar protein FlaG [Lachnospiraceae bacterium]
MAIEPLSSAMTYQAAPMQQSVSLKPAVEYTETGTQDAAGNVDHTTVKIVKAEDKQESGYSAQDQEEAAMQQENEKIKKYIDDLNKKMNNSEAQFGIHEATNRVTIKIVDKKTKEVIKEFPPEKTLDMIAKAWELAGILVDEKR